MAKYDVCLAPGCYEDVAQGWAFCSRHLVKLNEHTAHPSKRSGRPTRVAVKPGSPAQLTVAKALLAQRDPTHRETEAQWVQRAIKAHLARRVAAPAYDKALARRLGSPKSVYVGPELKQRVFALCPGFGQPAAFVNEAVRFRLDMERTNPEKTVIAPLDRLIAYCG